jgi:signal transduction histidine kinase
MRSLYLRIWLTVLAALALFALAAGWLVQRHLAQERERLEAVAQDRREAWAALLQRTLPPADAPREEQLRVLQEWSRHLRRPLALDDAQGRRLASSDAWLRRETFEGGPLRSLPIRLEDGRVLQVARRLPWGPGKGEHGAGPGAMAGAMGAGRHASMPDPGWLPAPPGLSPLPGAPPAALAIAPLLPGVPIVTGSLGLAALVVLLFVAVGVGAWPVVRRLTRRLETLQQGVERFGQGTLSQRVPEDGRDEVAAVAASFNRAAQRIETLVRSHQSLLANASHELRSPLARLKMALGLLEEAPAAQRARLRAEIDANIAELDVLVEEVLLASRLDAANDALAREPVDLLALAAEEAAHVGAAVEGTPLTVGGDERLLRRALRNLLENARRYGGGEILVSVSPQVSGGAELRVCDRGPGVPEAWRERVFEPFLRLPGHAEREGGVGLGLALVRQIARRHGGEAQCTAREGGGSCFTITLPG